MDNVDVIIIGAGAVGLAIAAELNRKFPGACIGVLDKEKQFGWHTSSRNSEVIHGGMYYPSGSLKAKLCVEGRSLLYEFCDQHKVPYQKIGKLIIARDESEILSIESLARQGEMNGVDDLRLIDRAQVAQMEPNIKAVAALYSPSTGILDSHKLMTKFELMFKSGDNNFIGYKHEVTGVEFTGSEYIVTYRTLDGITDQLACKWLINSTGLWADVVAGWLGIDIEKEGYRTYWVKGEYFSIPASKYKLVNHLVYPPPLRAMLGGGIHVTKTLDGRVRLGPSAFYVDTINYDVDRDHADQFYAEARYLPFLEREDVEPDMSGIRPKIQSPTDPQKDFVIRHEADKGLPGFINLVGIESPGLTSCIAIARMASNWVEI